MKITRRSQPSVQWRLALVVFDLLQAITPPARAQDRPPSMFRGNASIRSSAAVAYGIVSIGSREGTGFVRIPGLDPLSIFRVAECRPRPTSRAGQRGQLFTADPGTAGQQVPATVTTLEGPVAAEIDAKLRAAAGNGTSGAIIIERQGKVILRAGYGYANREDLIPFTTETIAQIGPVTKQFTAMAIVKLWADGRLSFQVPVRTYLPNAAEPAASVTLHQLLTHTSGMREYCGRDFEEASKAKLLADCAARPLRFPPGSQSGYSNPGYSLLAAVVEAASGKPIDEYLHATFFEPFSMASTGYAFPDVPRQKFAVGYLNGENQGVVSEKLRPLRGDFWNLKGNGGMQASTEDMYRWYRALTVDSSITDGMRQVALTPHVIEQVLTDGRKVAQGYGFNVIVAKDGQTEQISFAGSDGTFYSYFYWRPLERDFFYMVGNSGEKPTIEAIRAVRKILQENAATPRGDSGLDP